jgi:hypothetical protein
LQLQGIPLNVGLLGAVSTVEAPDFVVEVLGFAVVLLVLAVLEEIPTQYESPIQKLVTQSELTAGFQARNCALVMPNAASTFAQVSPDTTSYHLLPFISQLLRMKS